jgi:hypothetical protein
MGKIFVMESYDVKREVLGEWKTEGIGSLSTHKAEDPKKNSTEWKF